MKDLFSIAGKRVVVTGGSRGIGAMLAQGYVEHGAKVYISARREGELRETEERLNKLRPGACEAFQADLSTLEGIEAFVAEIKKRESTLHVLVNNAGASWGAAFEEFPEAGWDKVMNLNVKSPFFLTQQMLPLLSEAASAEDPARVINIASMQAFINPKMDNYSYSASKAALVHLTRHLAADLVQKHITVNAIAPGFFVSRMTAHLLVGQEEEVGAMMPLGRLGTPEDAAGTAIYLSSRASAWMTGQTLVLDGGVVANAG